MAVTLRDRTFQEPQEVAQLMDVIQGLALVAVDGKPVADKLSELSAMLPQLIAAGEGISQLGAEVKDVHVYQSAGAFAGRLAQVLITKAQV